ncbi:MAG: hypothetical protein Ta2A_17220 [Treponemataceae bacterium]|nr:MAG: hypothetical protein Ta2A_17220 [Treponemataceae bacterium]
MTETGIVTKIEGDIAEVRIERRGTTGGCCASEYTACVMRKALNDAQASVNDTVRIETHADSEQFRTTMLLVIALAAFLLSLALGEALGASLAVALECSALVSACAVTTTHIVYKKKPLPPNRIIKTLL